MQHVKLKAGALQLTLYIMVVIVLLLLAFVLFLNTHKQFKVQSDFAIQTVKNSDLGIQYACTNNIPLNDTTTVNSTELNNTSLKVFRSSWGVFEKVVSVSKIKTHTIKKVALLGGQQKGSQRTVLYNEDRNKPLVLVGNTRIEGAAFIPKQDVRTGNISGHSYYGTKLIYGSVRTAQALPEITNAELINNYYNLSTVETSDLLNLVEGKQYQNSFLEPLKEIISNTDIQLFGVSVTGHIIIRSKTKIVVDASSKLKDVLLIAPEIIIKNHVKGRFQAFASKKILVGNTVSLEYPSALFLKDDTQNTQTSTSANLDFSRLVIGSNTTIEGILAYLGENTPRNFKVQLALNESSLIKGNVYCNQNMELLGRVYGSVYAGNFLARQAGSIYQNHIYNGVASISELSENYAGLLLETTKKGVAKWLY